jgi:hypothetical protein
MYLAHVDADERVLVVEQVGGQRARELGLADARRSQEDEASRWDASDRASPTRSRRTARDTAETASSCPTTRFWQLILHLEELLRPRPASFDDRDAGHDADDGRDLDLR